MGEARQKVCHFKGTFIAARCQPPLGAALILEWNPSLLLIRLAKHWDNDDNGAEEANIDFYSQERSRYGLKIWPSENISVLWGFGLDSRRGLTGIHGV